MDCPLLCCPSHKFDVEHCSLCTNNHSFLLGLLSLNQSLLKKRRAKESEINKLRALISIAESKLKQMSAEDPVDPVKAENKGVPISEYLQRINLPSDLFSIVTSEELTIAFLVQCRYLPAVLICPECHLPVQIVYFSYTGYIYYCFVCRFRTKVKNITFFVNSYLTLEKALLLVFLWVLGVRDAEISNLLEASVSYVSVTSRKLRQLVGEEFLKSPPIFSGVVEIMEQDFVKKKIGGAGNTANVG
jgi:hypothetical protein